MAYQLIWEERGLWTRFYGTVSEDEFHEASSKIYSHEQFDSIRYWLADYLDLEKSELTEHTVRMTARFDRAAARSNPNIMLAIVYSQSQHLGEGFFVRECSRRNPMADFLF